MAATTSPDWLDSLSEEWVSEPRDPNSSPISNKTSESLQLHETTEEDDEVLETDLGYHEDVSLSDPDEIPSTMRVSKDIGLETPDWKRKIMEDITKGQPGPVKDLFSPMGLENIFQPPPPSQPSSPTRLQLQLPPTGTPPRHQFAETRGSMIPLPTSVMAATPPRIPFPPRMATPKLSPPRPQTKTSQISTPRQSEAPGDPATPITSPLHFHKQEPLLQYPRDSMGLSSGLKQAAASTLREIKQSLPLKFVEQNQVRLGKRKAYLTGDTADDSGPKAGSELKENQNPENQNPEKQTDSPTLTGEIPKNGSEDLEPGPGIFNDLEEESFSGTTELAPLEEDALGVSESRPSSHHTNTNTSEYPSSPPWLSRSSQQFEHTLYIPVSSSPLLEVQEPQEQEGGDDEEGILPPNELDAELARRREGEKTIAIEPQSLSEIPALSLGPPQTQNSPLNLASPRDPFAMPALPYPRISNPLRTPSPKKQDPPGPAPLNGSPLKLFAGTYDTFTKERLVRRISQLEGKTASSADESKELSEPTSEQLYGSNPEISVIEPAGTPLIHARPFQIVENSQMSLRRPRQRTGSSSSLPNDGIHGPGSPLKERTPKRMRRSWSGNRPSSLLTQEHKPGAEENHRRIAEEIGTVSQTAPRSSAPSPTPNPRKSPSTTTSPVVQGTSPIADNAKQELTQSPSNGGGSIIFGGSGEGSLMGMEFQGLGVGRDVSNKNRKGSVATQDFLAQAEEVMLRIRAMTAANGEQSWFSEGTAGLDSFLSGGELSLSTEEFSLMREKLLNFGIASTQKNGVHGQQGPGTLHNQSTAPTLMSAPAYPRRFSKPQDLDAGLTSCSGTTRRYPTSTNNQQDVIDALCAAVVSDKRTSNLENVTMRSKLKGISNGPNLPQTNRAVSAESDSSKSEFRSIHPAEIQHLLPICVGSMTFDPVQRAWVKQKAHTSEDVFQGIPDLSVDEEMEAAYRLHEVIKEVEEYVSAGPDGEAEFEHTTTTTKKAVRRRRIEREEIQRNIRGKWTLDDREADEDVTQESQGWDQTQHGGNESSDDISGEQHEESSWTDEDTEENETAVRQAHLGSSNGLESNHLAFTEPRIETRLTSWGDSVSERKREQPRMEEGLSQLSLMDSSQMGGAYDAELDELNEHTLEEEDGHGQQQRSSGDRVVDYSSPSVSTLSRQSRNGKGKRVDWVPDESDITIGQSSFQNSSMSQSPSKSFKILSSRNTNYNKKRHSSSGRSFLRRPVSRINEEDEDTEREGDRRGTSHARSFSSALTAASAKGKAPRDSKPVPPPATIQRSNVSYHFSSPLPELSYQFETTRELLNLELSYVAQRHGGVDGKGKQPSMKSIEYSFSVAKDNLVRHLTDVEPFEPYWEYMKSLKLNDRKILTVHGLHEWCPRIEELDVSTNEIGQVSGVPNSVRNLRICNNRLSSLTAWGHLTNLQYLDISGNGLDSLAGLRHMFHLRELRVDDNQITGLEEILHLDGLCSLSAKRNKIKSVNFDKASLARLTDLDLKGNGLERIQRLENLPSLSSLCIETNSISTLETPSGRKLETFRVLKLSGNRFESFDVTPFPNLRTLYIDDNALGKIHGLRKAKHLDSLSLREQSAEGDRVRNNTLPFDEMFEIRKIYASGNAICSLNLDLDFLNLQYLELAGVQLTSLQANFGHLVSNVRVLNLNFNAIADLRPLFGIVRLKKLLLVGNRIRSMKKIAAVLECFPSLSFLDLRSNPLTLGFYLPAQESMNQGNDSLPIEPFALAPLDENKDRTFQSRLDLETALLRRRYEIVISERCPRMKRLDGLQFRRTEVFRKDVVYDELRRVGLIKYAPEHSTPEPSSTPADGKIRNERHTRQPVAI